MGTVLGTILAFVIVFGILVFVHEFGHFFTAKLVGIRVETFSFGYGKRLLGFKMKGTDYRISLIPMGGYVKFLGEGEVSADQPGKLPPDHFLAKTRWQRFLVMVMGSVMNILLAVFIFTIINMTGVTVAAYEDEKPVIGFMEPGSPAQKSGLEVGDEILSIDGEKVRTWNDVEVTVGTMPDRVITVDVLRNEAVRSFRLRTEKKTRYDLGYAGFTGKILIQIMAVTPGTPAAKAGLEPGDIIEAIDGTPVYYFQFTPLLEKNPGRELKFLVDRNGRELTLGVTPRLEGGVGKIGIISGPQSETKKYGFFAAIGQSVETNVKNVFLIVRFLRDLFIGRASTQQLGGPLEIARFSFAALQMGFMSLITWIGLISLQLGVINLFPIPVFDGGQIFVLGLEGLFRRDFSPKVRQIWMQVGFVIFVFLIAFVILNDFVKRMPHGWGSLLPW